MLYYKKVRKLLVCALLAICLLLFPIALNGLTDINGDIAEAAGAFRTYTLINVELADESYRPYAGLTTVAGLKKNLVVKGTTNGNQEFTDNDTYVLFSEEYEVRINGELKDDAYVIGSGDAEENILTLTVVCGSLTSDILLPLSDDAPDLTGEVSFTVENGSLTDDYNAENLYKVLTVKAGETVLTPDLYTVEMEDIYGKSSAEITVNVNGKTAVKTVSVRAAELKGVDLRVKPEFSLTGGRYKDKDGRDAFIQGANPEGVFKNLDVVAIFENGRKTLSLTFNSQNNLVGAETGETVSSNLTGSAGETENFTVTVERNGRYATSSSLTITFAKTEIIKIAVNKKALDEWNERNRGTENLKPYTTLDLVNMAGDDNTPVFKLLRNDGGEEAVTSSNIKVDGSLAPDAATADANPSVYQKDIKIVTTDGTVSSEPVTIKYINFALPDSLQIEGDFATQIKHHDADMSGLTLVLSYKVGPRTYPASVPLIDYEKYVTPTIYKGDEVQNKILTDSDYLQLSINYNGKTAEKSGDITPVDDRIILPMTDVSTITYSEGCAKTFENFQSDKMRIEVFIDENCMVPAESGAYSVNGGKVSFNGGGSYYIKVSLNATGGRIQAADGVLYPEEEFILYYEGTTPSGITLAGNGRSAVYAIRINKGILAVNLAVKDEAAEIYYGDNLRGLINVTGTSNGRTSALDSLNVKYKLVLVRKGAAFDYDNCTYLNYTEPLKVNAGIYTVYAVSEETEAYLAGKVRSNKSIEITVLPKELDASNLVASVEYARKAYELKEFVSYDGFAGGETADNALEIKGKTNSSGVTVEELRFADTYDVIVGIKQNGETDEYNYNYIWSDKTYTDKTVSVEITKKQFKGFGATLAENQKSFYFGETSTAPEAYISGGDDAYFTVNAAQYFKIDGASETLVTEADFSKWGIGVYKIKYSVTPVYIDGEGNVDGVPNDFVLPAAEAEFEITAAVISPVTVDVDGWVNGGTFVLGDYKESGYTKTLSGWTENLLHGSTGKKVYEALIFGVVYTPLTDGHSITEPEPSPNGSLIFKDAGKYVITLSLKDGNYKWSEDQPEGKIEFTVTVDRASVAEPELSERVTYNATAQTVIINNWADINGKAEYSVTGATLAANGTTVTPSGGTFAVTFAGDYSVVFVLADSNNYGWGDEKSVDNVTKTYTVNQADLQVVWNTDNADFDDANAVQNIAAKASVSGVPDADKLIVTDFEIFTDPDCAPNHKIEADQVTYAGVFYLKVSAFGLKDGVTDFSAENYKLNYDASNAQTKLILTYIINSQVLELPVLTAENYPTASVDNSANSVTAIYKGFAYLLTEFFKDANKYVAGADGSKSRIVISGGELKDVKDGNYTVTVAPADDYVWKDREGDAATQAITYIFIIEEYEIEFVWKTTEFVYDGTAKTPAAEASGLLGDDTAANVAIDVSANGTQAGVYDIAFSDLSLSGARARNYRLKTVAVTQKFTVKRAIVSAPAADKDGATFNEKKQSVSFTLPANDGVFGWSWNNVSVVATGAASDGSYGYENDSFTFYHAGAYTVSFTLPNGNYCWTESQQSVFGGADYSLVHTYTLNVDKMSVEAPALGVNRAIELGDGAFGGFTLENAAGVKTLYAYGEYDGGAYTVIEDFLNATLSRKVYFVKLTFSPDTAKDGFIPFAEDYSWAVNAVDSNPDQPDEANKKAWGYLASAGGTYGKTEGVEMFLCFVVTKTQVSAEFSVSGYTFGDNGFYNDGGTIKFDKSFSGEGLTFENMSETGFIFVTDNKVPADANYTVTVTFCTDAEGKIPVSSDNMVNGLPWAQGAYYVKIEINFHGAEEGLDSDYQDFSRLPSFTVAPRSVETVWEDKPESVYNGAPQNRTANVSNARYSTEACLEGETPVLTITTSGNGFNGTGNPVNVNYSGGAVSAYALRVTAVGGSNYTVTGGINLESSFKITPMELTVNVKEISDYVYGDSLEVLKNLNKDNYSDYYEVAAGTVFNDEFGCIVIEIEGATDEYGLYEVGGSYTAVPALKNANGNYTLNAISASAAFVVNKREITVEFTGVAENVYGDAVELNVDEKFTVTGGLGLNRTAENVFKLYLENSDSVRADDGNVTAKAGEYLVKLDNLDQNNYTVNFTDTAYIIKKAQITSAIADGYTGDYDGEAHEAIINYSASVVNGATVNPLTWYIAKVDTEDYVEVSRGKITDVGDGGEYKVKVSAPNHEDKILEHTVNVTVNKINVTVSVNIDIFYGEAGPEAHGESSGKYFKQSFDELVKSDGIYTVTGFVAGDETAFRAGTLKGLTNNNGFSYGYASGVTYTQGVSGKGDYALVFDCGPLTAENYNFVGGAGRLRVEPLPVTVKINNLSAAYNQNNPPAVETAVGEITTAQTSVYDGSLIIIYGVETKANIVTVSTDALTSVTGRTTNNAAAYGINPSSVDGNRYSVTYSFEDGATRATYTIIRADNEFNGDYGLFENAVSYDEALNSGSEKSWVYGDYEASHLDGYNPDGNHKTVEAAFLYDEENAEAIYEIYKDGSSSPLDTAESLSALFAKVWAAKGFGAGDYCVSITFPAGDNYKEFTAERYFRIAKQEVTVTAGDRAVIYGEELSELSGGNVSASLFPFSVSGLVKNGGISDDLNNVVAFELVTDYSAGAKVNAEYKIFVKNAVYPENGNYVYQADNYEVTFIDGSVTVEKRTVKISVDAKENYFDLYDNDKTDKVDVRKELTFRVKENSFYSGDLNMGSLVLNNPYGVSVQKVFALQTHAFDSFNLNGTAYATNAAGEYAIYAVFNAGDFGGNYNLVIDGDRNYSGDGAITNGDGSFNAGTFTIEKARVTLGDIQTFYKDGGEYILYSDGNDRTYDNKNKYLMPTTVGDLISENKIEIVYTYYEQIEGVYTEISEAPKEAGNYRVNFSFNNENYVSTTAQQTLIIAPKTLNIQYSVSDNVSWGSDHVYKGSDYSFYITFQGVIDGGETLEKIKAEFTGENRGTGFVIPSDGNNVLECKAVNAGRYEFSMDFGGIRNYSLSSYTDGFTINKRVLTVSAVNSDVQYGTRIENIDNLKVTYSGAIPSGMTAEEFYAQEILKGLADPADVTCSVENYSYKDVGGTFVIKVNASSVTQTTENFEIHTVNGTLTVIKRALTVNIIGWGDIEGTDNRGEPWSGISRPYGTADHQKELNDELASDPQKFIMLNVDTVDVGPFDGMDTDECCRALKIRLTISSGAKDAGDYGMIPTCENGNLNVTFKNYGDEDITEIGDYNDARLPKYNIAKLKLKVKVAPAGTINYNYGNSFNVVYGAAADFNSDYSLIFDGWHTGEGNYSGNISAGAQGSLVAVAQALKEGAVYEAWTHIAGDVFKIKPVISGITFTNYDIVSEEVSFTVVSRTISAEANDGVYEKSDEGYNHGGDGAEKAAVITFTDFEGNRYDNALTQTVFNREYYKDGVNVGVPKNAGDYTVKIVIDKNVNGKYNFIFEGNKDNSTVSYKINKKSLGLSVVTTSVDYKEGTEKVKTVNGFISDIMDVVTFTRTGNDGIVKDLGKNFEDGLMLAPDTLGRYTVTFRFNPTAENNYGWNGGEEQVTLTFWVVNADNKIEIAGLTINGWSFGGTANQPTATLKPAGSSGTISYAYAKVNKTYWDKITAEGELSDISSLGLTVYNFTDIPYDAGWYVVKASLPAQENADGEEITPEVRAYYVFRISRAMVGAPSFGIILSGENANVTYTGERLSTEVVYNTDQLNIIYGGTREPLAGGARLFALNKGVYTASFGIVNTDNFTWADDIDLEALAAGTNGHLSVEWSGEGESKRLVFTQTVDAATDNAVEWLTENITAVYGDAFDAPNAQSNKYADSIVIIEYALQGTDVWKTSVSDAGVYRIRATVSSRDDNFNTASDDGITLTINKRELSVTVNGVISYGQAFVTNGFTYRINGFLAGATEANSFEKTDNGLGGTGVRFKLAQTVENENRLSAGKYALTLEGETEVAGLLSKNYKLPVSAVSGTLTVNKSAIAVKIGSVNSFYRENINLDSAYEGMRVVSGSFAAWDDGADFENLLKIKLKTEAQTVNGVYKNVGNYEITEESWSSENYEVTFYAGTYRIDALEINVEVGSGGGVYGGEIKGVEVEKVYKIVNGVKTEINFTEYGLELLCEYVGKTNGNAEYVSTERPSEAGTYSATVKCSDSNYNLTGAASVPFVIEKREIDAGKLIIEHGVYNGKAQSPHITDNFFNVNGEEVYEAVPHTGEWINAGDYTITLRMTDFNNMKWKSVDVRDRELTFTIDKAENALTGNITIENWVYRQYDEIKNAPKAVVKFGTPLFVYSDSKNGPFLPGAPRFDEAGTYWVSLTVSADTNGNYYELPYTRIQPVEFKITPVLLTAPEIKVISDGEGKNDTYTGGELRAEVLGYDTSRMQIVYDRVSNLSDGIWVNATNAGTYTVKFKLNDSRNYAWEDGTETDGENYAVYEWKVARKRVAKPEADNRLFMVDGSVITYIPLGFDADIMDIRDNEAGYGGDFTAVISLKDTQNYMWSDGTDAEFGIKWTVLGVSTVFTVIMCSLGGGCLVACGAALAQFVAFRKKKAAEAEGPEDEGADGDGDKKSGEVK